MGLQLVDSDTHDRSTSIGNECYYPFPLHFPSHIRFDFDFNFIGGMNAGRIPKTWRLTAFCFLDMITDGVGGRIALLSSFSHFVPFIFFNVSVMGLFPGLFSLMYDCMF